MRPEVCGHDPCFSRKRKATAAQIQSSVQQEHPIPNTSASNNLPLTRFPQEHSLTRLPTSKQSCHKNIPSTTPQGIQNAKSIASGKEADQHQQEMASTSSTRNAMNTGKQQHYLGHQESGSSPLRISVATLIIEELAPSFSMKFSRRWFWQEDS